MPSYAKYGIVHEVESKSTKQWYTIQRLDRNGIKTENGTHIGNRFIIISAKSCLIASTPVDA